MAPIPRKATLDLASLYAFCWQSLERAERSMDSERLLCVAQMLCRSVNGPDVEGSGELGGFRCFLGHFLEGHRIHAEFCDFNENLDTSPQLLIGI